MYLNGVAVVTLTKWGVETALKIKTALTNLQVPCRVYAPKKFKHEGVFPLDKKLDESIKQIYSEVDAVVAVMATGIIIRAVAPYLQNKLVDPAVLGVDADGKFVISLLSGHYGGANQLTRLIAEGIGATAVITTASDSLGKQSVDELARTLHLTVVNPKSLVKVNSALVNNEHLALILVGNVKVPAEAVDGYAVEKAENALQAAEIVNKCDAAAIISKEPIPTDRITKPITVLRPKHIVMGIGARKDAAESQILHAVGEALKKANLPLERIDGLATVDIKKNSKSMIKAAEKLGLSFEFFTVEQLRGLKHEDLSSDSKMVEEKIGVGGVCERAALIKAGKNPHLILKKQKLNGVTVAIAEGE